SHRGRLIMLYELYYLIDRGLRRQGTGIQNGHESSLMVPEPESTIAHSQWLRGGHAKRYCESYCIPCLLHINCYVNLNQRAASRPLAPNIPR
ncbi:MAG: hypothetical protein WB444_04505, partial [Gallionella sp.]